MVSPTVSRIKGLQSGLAIKAPVAVATTANLASLSGLQTIDGVVLTEGARVLVRGQTDTKQNGVWNASTGAWTRALDFDGNTDIVNGTLVLVAGGVTYAGKLFKTVGADPITPDTSAITFVAYADFTTLLAWASAFLSAADAPTGLALIGAAALNVANVFTQDQTLGVGRGLIFEGATDDAFETTLKATDPTADHVVWLPNLDGTLALLDAAQLFTKNQRPAYDNTQTVAGGGSFTFNAAAMAQEILITATGAGTVTMSAPTNVVEGMMYKFIFKAGDTNARAMAWNSAFKWASATPAIAALSQTTGAYDIVTFVGGPSNTLIQDGGKDIR